MTDLEQPTASRRLMQWAGSVSDAQLFVFTVLWVVAGGLALQLVVLPYFLSGMHWGHGLIAGMDWTNFHTIAASQAQKIAQQGWGRWELRPGSQLPAGIASALYAVSYPEPWVVLPVNGLFFATAVTGVRRMLAVMFNSPAVGLWAVAPFFLFLSFVPIWGQLHKDVSTGAGFTLILCALVLARQTDRQVGGAQLATASAIGMWLAWLSRPYVTYVLVASTLAFVAIARLDRKCHRIRLARVAATVLAAAILLNVGPWRDPTAVIRRPLPPQASPSGVTPSRGAAKPPLAPVVPSDRTPKSPWPQAVVEWISEKIPRSRRIDPKIFFEDLRDNTQRCAPNPTTQLFDRFLFSVCVVREGFRSNGVEAGSNHDYELRMRSAEDFVAYFPRAAQIAFVEPMPQRWGTETSDIGRLARYLVPFEMTAAYGALLMAAIAARRRLAHHVIWAVVAYCSIYTLFFVYVMPNMGTVYRMRAFAFTIIVSTALAALLARSTDPSRVL